MKSGPGTLGLTGANSYTGNTYVNAGTLLVGNNTTTVTSFNSVNGGNPPLAASSFGRPTTVANGTIDIGGVAQGGVSLKYTGPGETTDRIINFIFNGNGATKTIDASGTGFLKFTGTFTSNSSPSNDMQLGGTGGGEIVGGKTYAGYLDTARSWTEGTTPPPRHVPGTPSGYLGNPVGGAANYGGKMFDDCVSQVQGILNNFGTQYPQYAAQGYQIAGIGWFQGFNDTVTTTFPERYEANLVNFINAYRSALNAPDAQFVVATCGFGGYTATGGTLTVINAQLAVGDPLKYPAFAGKVKTMETRGYWRDAADSPVPNGSQGYHYNHNSETFMLVGDAMGRGMIDLLGLVPSSDYGTWAAIYGPANLSDPNADLDGDGLTNEEERAFGLNPASGAAANPVSIPLNATTGTFSYTRRNPALTGLNYTVWTSTNL